MNLNVLKMTIQGLEMQRSTLSTMQSGMEGAAKFMQDQGRRVSIRRRPGNPDRASQFGRFTPFANSPFTGAPFTGAAGRRGGYKRH